MNAQINEKKSISERERMLLLIKEHINEPKQLKEIKKNNSHVKVDFDQLVH